MNQFQQHFLPILHARINPLPWRSILHYSNGEVIRQPSLHNHHSEDEKNTVKSVLSTIKTASSSSRVAPSLVVANATGDLSAADRLMLPSDRAMKKVSQRAYQREHPNQRAPPTLSALVLTNDDLLNSNQQPMLIYDNHHATRRIIVLGACALAFVPTQDVPAAWDEISQQFPVSDKFDAFVTYFERKWLDAVRANQNLSFNALARHGGGVPGPVYYWYVIIYTKTNLLVGS